MKVGLLVALGLACATAPIAGSEAAPRFGSEPESVSASEPGSEAEASEEPSDEPVDEYEARRRAAVARFTELLRRVDPEWLAGLDCESYEADCSASEHAGFELASYWRSGSGVDAGHYGETRIYRDAALVVGELTGSTDGAYVSTLRLRPATPSTLEAWARANDTRWVSDDDPARSRAELFLSAKNDVRVRRGSGFSVRGPLYQHSSNLTNETCESWYDERALPPVHLVSERGIEDVILFQWDEPVDRSTRERLFRVAALRCPDDLEQHVGEHRVRVYELYGRNAGVAVALRGVDGNFRWALETRNAVLGSNVKWIGAQRGWIFGYTRSRHPGYIYADTGALFAIRARDGVAATIEVPPVFAEGMVALGLGNNDDIDEDERERDLEIQLSSNQLRMMRPDGEHYEISTPDLMAVLNEI